MAQGVVESSIVEMTKQFKNLLEQDLDEARKEETTSITRFMKKSGRISKKQKHQILILLQKQVCLEKN